LNTFLENNRKEFSPDQFAELFEDATSYIEVHPELDRDHPLVVFRRYPRRLQPVLKIAPGAPQVMNWFVEKLNPSDYQIKQPSAKRRSRSRKKAASLA